MDLRKEWQKLHQDKFHYSPINKEQIMKAIYQESTTTIAILKKRLKGKLYWIIFFISVGLLWMSFSLDNTELLKLQAFFVLNYIIGLIFVGWQYRKIDADINIADQTLSLMKKQNKAVTQALKLENLWGVEAFPLFIIGGLLLGDIYEGKKIIDIFQDSSFLLLALGCILFLTPIMYALTKKMNEKVFGTELENLQNNIRRLEDLA